MKADNTPEYHTIKCRDSKWNNGTMPGNEKSNLRQEGDQTVADIETPPVHPAMGNGGTSRLMGHRAAFPS